MATVIYNSFQFPATSSQGKLAGSWRLEARSYSMRVAIIGAGPAGAMAAIRLARAGASVQLFDASHPREKPCGGGVTGRALALLADVVDVETLPAVVVKSATVEAQENGSRTPFPARVDLIDRGIARESSLVVLSRAVFDAALVKAAVGSG